MVSSPSAGQTSLSCQPAFHSLLSPRDAWNSLGKMSREQAMSAYVTEMKLVAQRVGRGCRFLSVTKLSARWPAPHPSSLTPIMFPAR